MKIGKLYEIKKEFWMLYPSKDIAAAVVARGGSSAHPIGPPAAAFYSEHFKCNVSYIAPNGIFCLLEQDEKFIKVLSTNGELGWIILTDQCWFILTDHSTDVIEEVNQ
jgi:hypothetical protein